MNVEQVLSEIGKDNNNALPIEGIKAAKENWALFYPELERLIEQFIADDTSLSDEQQAVLFFGTFLLAELKYAPALAICLQLFSRNDTFLSPIEGVFGDALTELTPSLFYNVADGRTQILSDYIVDGHQAMYCKASAIEAIFAQYESGDIDHKDLSAHVTRWLAVFLALPSATNSFLLSALADYCIEYQLDNFKPQFIDLCDKGLFDEDRFKNDEVKAWNKTEHATLIASGTIQTEFNLVHILSTWSDGDSTAEELSMSINGDLNEFDSLMGEGGLLANILYDENTILENSVALSTLKSSGRNDPCPCGSDKKYKKCCLLKK